MKLLQINTVINSGSTGRIAENLGKTAMANGWQSYIAYGRNPRPSESQAIKIGNKLDVYHHVLQTRLFDNHGFASKNATRKLISIIKQIQPDIIHLHNIHGYYLNVAILFNFLKVANIPVVWTLHDCWAFTGHCCCYTAADCCRFQRECFACPEKSQYPASIGSDNSLENFNLKKQLFTGLDNLTIVTPSVWLAHEVDKSFLQDYKCVVINNGIDLSVFKPTENDLPKQIDTSKKIVLGVANVWSRRKGLDDFIRLSEILDDDYQIVMVGLTAKQIKSLPKKIVGLKRTESISELASLYTAASVFVNPTYEDNFPTTNIESLACGTPVITYNVGGSPEIIDEHTGFVVECGDLESLRLDIYKIGNQDKSLYRQKCIDRATRLFNSDDKYAQYFELYQDVLEGVLKS